jgi:hypothetical protein
MTKIRHIPEQPIFTDIESAPIPNPSLNNIKIFRKDDGLWYEKDNTGVEKIINLYVVQQFSGQFLLDPNEVNGWGVQGFVDNINAQDLGNLGAANLSRVSGGFVFPFDVRIKRISAWHRNSNNSAEAWGWVVYRQQKTNASNAIVTTFMLDESFDRGNGQLNLRDYGNNQNQFSDLTSFVNDVIPAFELIGIAVGAPTANTTNYYVQVYGGMVEFERI